LTLFTNSAKPAAELQISSSHDDADECRKPPAAFVAGVWI
jgi:hypothetical protein